MVGEFFESGEKLTASGGMNLHIVVDRLEFKSLIVLVAEVADDCEEIVIFLLHLLVVAAALFGLSGADELLHGLEDLVHPPHVSVDKVPIVDL
jgi:hypothetical protein